MVGYRGLPLIAGLDVVGPAMILGEGLTIPGLDLCPRLWGIRPERMVSGKSERHETQTRQVERAIVGIPVGNLGLRATETNRQIASIVEILLEVEHAMMHLCQGSSHLAIAQLLGQLLIPSYQG